MSFVESVKFWAGKLFAETAATVFSMIVLYVALWVYDRWNRRK